MASDIPVDPFSAVFRRFFCPFFIAVPASPSESRISFRLESAVRRRSSAAKMRHCSIDCSRVRGGIQESGKRQRDAGRGLCYKSSHFETFLLNWENSCCPTTALRTKTDRSPLPFGRDRARHPDPKRSAPACRLPFGRSKIRIRIPRSDYVRPGRRGRE